uniref:Uncharacterized protein n=1 Tax=Candidatus Kentrum sp. UNK TaxID=2126344 RepID=A0A451A1B8_9GAMM|nr:MAG: hypothetical protein BECKUNK1418G_GA0071005_100916 [Candidatus Kentron sp. UNK]VFK70121.1 MAG: hypothetical protein BECKUNK1418H_GA0071006_102416 [Candidatus Kentron sp. UNK]
MEHLRPRVMGVVPDAVTDLLAAKPSWHLADPGSGTGWSCGESAHHWPGTIGCRQDRAACRHTARRGTGYRLPHPLLDELVFALLGNLRQIPFGYGPGRSRLRVESRKVEMEQVMVESFDATPCYLRPQLIVKTLREPQGRIDDGI